MTVTLLGLLFVLVILIVIRAKRQEREESELYRTPELQAFQKRIRRNYDDIDIQTGDDDDDRGTEGLDGPR